ncbi:MAG: 5-formyltetrahydrofolate cyclo-ligase [Eubacteriales bacterium]
METKKHIRKEALLKRNQLSLEDRSVFSKKICETLMAKEFFQKADVILTYLSYQSEVATDTIINYSLSQGKEVFAPKVIERSDFPYMEFYKVQNMNEIMIGYKGIREPYSEENQKFSYEVDAEKKHKRVVMIMPGVAFSKDRVRIGYGKGFYDYYLSQKIQIYTVAFSYECQIYHNIQSEEYDMKPYEIITECREFS